jgi:hypothetical protein
MPWDLGADRLRAIVEPLPSGHDYEPRGAAHSELCGSTRGRPLSLLIARKLPFRYRPTQATSRMADFSEGRLGSGPAGIHPMRSEMAEIFWSVRLPYQFAFSVHRLCSA